MALHAMRARGSAKRLRTGEEGKKRATRLGGMIWVVVAMVAIFLDYGAELYLAYLYDLVDVLNLRGIYARLLD